MSAPMELQRALEDGIEACDYLGRCGHHDSAKFRQATATLRACKIPEALARLKALEEQLREMRDLEHRSRWINPQGRELLLIRWADEIADIRTKLEGK